jgi:2-dehydro-3-deoxyphosphogluconate aldolase / (4S)-4-hydroxy-2-oxoglutarate aldolase
MTAREVLNVSPIIPVVAIEDADKAVDLAHALIEGGINIIEVTLRTNQAMQAMENIVKNVPEMILGAGTVINAEQYDKVCDLGAQFVISPGYTKMLLEYTRKTNIPLIPGVATASEIMGAMDFGLNTFKLFPANIVGGVDAIKSFSGPFNDAMFCPTGGVNEDNLQDYLNLCNVGCVGGTWLASKKLIQNEEFDLIKRNCKEALAKIKE